MTNWLADPVACAIRLKEKAGCIILAGRNEVMSRSTRAVRTEEPEGPRWSWGHISATRDKRGIRLAVTEEVNSKVTNTQYSAPLSPHHATVASDLLRAAAVDAGGSACGGKTILELLWDELDSIMERLMTGTEADDERDPGRAEGVAYAIAVMQNPYLPSIDAVREKAMERWEEAQAADPPRQTPAEGAQVKRRPRRRRAR